MELLQYIEHPQRLNSDTLKYLKDLVAKYPYYSAARLLFLQNLFVLHSEDFTTELHKASLFLPNREVLYEIVEGKEEDVFSHEEQIEPINEVIELTNSGPLDLVENEIQESTEEYKLKDKEPMVADAQTDYTGFLMQLNDIEEETEGDNTDVLGSLIRSSEKIELKKIDSVQIPLETLDVEANKEDEEEYLTETLAEIYIKQGKYEKALEIIRKLYLVCPKKNIYFADQIRFLEKLVLNNKNQ